MVMDREHLAEEVEHVERSIIRPQDKCAADDPARPQRDRQAGGGQPPELARAVAGDHSRMPSCLTGEPATRAPMQSAELLDAREESLGQYVGGTCRCAWPAPYRGALVNLFLQPYKQGYAQSAGPAPLTGSAIRDEPMARAQPTPPSSDQHALLAQIVVLWDAWSDALDRYLEGV